MSNTLSAFKQLNMDLDATLEELRRPAGAEPEPEPPRETICDRCGRSLPIDEAMAGEGEWEGATLCPDCYAATTAEVGPKSDGYTKPHNDGKPGGDRSWYRAVYCGARNPMLDKRFRLPDLGPKCSSRL